MPKSEHLNGEPVKNQQQLARALGVGFALFGLACSSSGGSGNPGSGGTMSGGGTAGSAGAAGFGGAGGGAANGPTGDPLSDKFVCPDQAGAPAVAAVHPTVEQEAYQHVELTAYIHYGLDTFDGTEQGNVSDTAAVFNPTNLTQATVDHWVSTLQNAGFQQVQLTDKHSTGFCLWQSATTNYSVANSPWMGGKGDLVKMFTDSMKRANLRVGVYLSPWDQRVPSSVQSYGSVLTEQLTELLTNYGNVYEITWDGFNSAGSHGTPATVDWAKISQKDKTLQPHILVLAGPRVPRENVGRKPAELPRPSVDRERERTSEPDHLEPRPHKLCRAFGRHDGGEEPLVPVRVQRLVEHAELVLASEPAAHVRGVDGADLFQDDRHELDPNFQHSARPNRRLRSDRKSTRL